ADLPGALRVPAVPQHPQQQAAVDPAGGIQRHAPGSRNLARPSDHPAGDLSRMSHAVSVVIPMFNEARHILRTLEAVRTAAQAAGCAWEVIVVDNGSSDQGPELARDWGAQVLDCPGLNIAALRNRGAAVARHDWLAFLDADMQVPEQWLVTWRQVRQADRAEMLGLVHRPPAQAPWYARAWLHKVAAEREREEIGRASCRERVESTVGAGAGTRKRWRERCG